MTLENILKTRYQQKNCNLCDLSIKLESFSKFKDTKEALKATASMIEGKLPKKLKKFLSKNIISKEV